MFTEIPLLRYIDIEEEQIDMYIHTKDGKLIFVSDVVSDMTIDSYAVHVMHRWLEEDYTVVVPRSDFLYMEYRIMNRVKAYTLAENLSESFLEADENLFDDLL